MTVEEYIKAYTLRCSNKNSAGQNIPWLKIYHAEQVALIAREETIEKVCEWLKDCSTFTDMNGNIRVDEEMYNATVEELKNYLKDKA